MPTKEQKAEYKRRWRERHHEQYLAWRRRWHKKNHEKLRAQRKARRQKAKDRGRCGICIHRYTEPGYKTCLHCLEWIAGKRQVQRETAA